MLLQLAKINALSPVFQQVPGFNPAGTLTLLLSSVVHHLHCVFVLLLLPRYFRVFHRFPFFGHCLFCGREYVGIVYGSCANPCV